LQECPHGFAWLFCKHRAINVCKILFYPRTTIALQFCFQCSVVEAKRLKSLRRLVGMLWTIFVILLVLWLLGLVSSYTLGGFIHILLVLAVIVLILQLVSGRRAAL
jgi:hypothetical protein